MSLPGQCYLALLVIGIAGLAWSGRRREPASILILGVTALLPLISNRHYPLFAFSLVVLGGEHIADVGNRWLQPTRFASGHGRGFAAVGVVVSLVLVGLSIPRFGCIRGHFLCPLHARGVPGSRPDPAKSDPVPPR